MIIEEDSSGNGYYIRLITGCSPTPTLLETDLLYLEADVNVGTGIAVEPSPLIVTWLSAKDFSDALTDINIIHIFFLFFMNGCDYVLHAAAGQIMR